MSCSSALSLSLSLCVCLSLALTRLSRHALVVQDGMVGETLIFRRRGEPDRQAGLRQQLPKRMRFVMDVSASMSRFNQWDRRLDRLAQATVLSCYAATRTETLAASASFLFKVSFSRGAKGACVLRSAARPS